MLKRVRAVVEAGPNYIFHLMAVARNGFDSDYADKYRDSVNPADILVLEEQRRELSFRDGGSGNLTYLLIFFPAYLNLDTRASLEEYFALLNSGLESGDCSGFYARYEDAFDRQRDWTHSVGPEWLLRTHREYNDAIRRLGEVYTANFTPYMTRVWPVESKDMQAVASQLNPYLEDVDLIGRWERLLGIEFKVHPYEIVLCSAIKNGPSANSLGYERNVFYSGDDMDYIKKFISHEVGTYILFPVLRDLPSERDPSLAYKAFESLARFYNSLALGTKDLYPMGTYYDADRFFSIYEDIHRTCPGMSPKEMILEGMARYRQM